jgi:hypothetical protein
MHSEDIADHDKLKSLIDTRRSEAQSDAERSSIDLFMDFENKHRKSLCSTVMEELIQEARFWSDSDDILVGMMLWSGLPLRKKRNI